MGEEEGGGRREERGEGGEGGCGERWRGRGEKSEEGNGVVVVKTDTLSLKGMLYMYINTMERKQCQKIMPLSSTGFKGTFLRTNTLWPDSGTPHLEMGQRWSSHTDWRQLSTWALPKSLCLNIHVYKMLLVYRADGIKAHPQTHPPHPPTSQSPFPNFLHFSVIRDPVSPQHTRCKTKAIGCSWH